MIILKNTTEDKILESVDNQNDLIERIKKIAKENDDEDIEISSGYHAIQYVKQFCSNLEIIII